MSESLSPRTLAAQALGGIDEETRALVRSVHLSSTFIRDPDNLYRAGDVYGRPDNATVREAEAVIGALEGAAETLVLGSGMSAAVALFLSLGPGAHVVAPEVMYWALRSWLANEAPALGVHVDFAETEDLAAIERAIKPGATKLVWLETPSNPLWGISDIQAAARVAHAVGAVLGVDSTCATPIFTQPIALGADVVMHSATKYLNGHSDLVAGALCFARGDGLFERARDIRKAHGLILHPFEAGASGRSICACAPRRRTQWSLRSASPITPPSLPCSTPDCVIILATRSPRGRCAAGSAACCRSVSAAGRRPPSRRRRG